MSSLQSLTEQLWINSSELFTYHSGVLVSEASAVVIDPGLAESEINALSAFVREKAWKVQAVILTHGHWDHILGTEAFPDVPILTQRLYLASTQNDAKGIARIVEKTTDLGRTIPFQVPVPARTFDERETVRLGGLELELVHTPGHAPDHMFIYERAGGLVWTADMLSDQEIPYVSDNLNAFVQTCSRINPADFQWLVPCHGNPTNDPVEIRARIENDRAYLLELKGRVEDAVRAGMTLDETKQACLNIHYRQAEDDNRGAHRRNVESAYAELGGPVHPDTVGWGKSWLEFTA